MFDPSFTETVTNLLYYFHHYAVTTGFLTSVSSVCMSCNWIPLHFESEIYFACKLKLCLFVMGVPQKKILHWSKKKTLQNVLHCWLWWAADNRKGRWYIGGSSSWRRALSWLWKSAASTVSCRLEEVSAHCKCVRCWGMLSHCMACESYLRWWQISKKPPASLQWHQFLHSSYTACNFYMELLTEIALNIIFQDGWKEGSSHKTD